MIVCFGFREVKPQRILDASSNGTPVPRSGAPGISLADAAIFRRRLYLQG